MVNWRKTNFGVHVPPDLQVDFDTSINALEILLHDTPIGTITRYGADRTVFVFNEEYINNDNRATLSLSFYGESRVLKTDVRAYQTQLIPFFSNLLPEGPLRHWLAAQHGFKPEREFMLLSALGTDLPGAIKTRPITVEGAPILPDTASIERPNPTNNSDLVMGFSLAGVQMKFSGLRNAQGRITIPARGWGGNWIIKLPSTVYQGMPETEFAMMELARKIGINTPRTELIDGRDIDNLPSSFEADADSPVFAIERFDRSLDTGAIHAEDFAQVFGIYPDDKYTKGSMTNIAQRLVDENGLDDIPELIRRIVFNGLIGNGDMHLKNWSLIYRDGVRGSLAPAYDFIPSIAWIPKDNLALKLSHSKNFADFNKAQLEALADRSAIPPRLVIRIASETVALFNQHWQAEKNHLPMIDAARTAIDAHLKKLPLIREV